MRDRNRSPRSAGGWPLHPIWASELLGVTGGLGLMLLLRHRTTEKGRLLFVLLTPAGQPRVHQRRQSIIATLLHESEYVKERLMTATAVE